MNGPKDTLLKAIVIIVSLLHITDAQTWCYRCVSTQPGCGEYGFDWRWYWSYTCPREGDKCVKLIERKGAETIVTRECLSLLEGYRRDIPADRFEGCRPAALDVKLGLYTFNNIKELDIKRDSFDDTTYCFCDFDWFCNGSQTPKMTLKFLMTLMLAQIIYLLFAR